MANKQISWVTIVLIVLLTSFVSYNLFFIWLDNAILGENFMFKYKMNTIINSAKNDTYVSNVVKLCNFADDNRDKIDCVFNFFNTVYKRKNSAEFNSIEYTLLNGTDCKNSVVFYCAVFRAMNLSCNPVVMEDHTYANVDYDSGYCTVDQNLLNCRVYLNKTDVKGNV
jgi:hypothetical protein